MSEGQQKKLIWLILSTLIIRYLWTFHPDNYIYEDPNLIPEYKLFPFSDQKISWPSYLFFPCLYVVELINVKVWMNVFGRYKNIFHVWFAILVIQFGEYFLTYNKAQMHVHFGRFPLPVDLTLAKMVLLPGMFLLYDVIWRGNNTLKN